MHSYFVPLCKNKRIILVTDTTTTYLIDSAAITKAKADSIFSKELFSLEKDYDVRSVSEEILLLQSDSGMNSIRQEVSGNVGNNKMFTLEQDDGVFALLLFCFFCITRIYKDSSSFFTENTRLIFSMRENVNLFAQTTIKEFWFNFVLIFQSILLTSIILFDYFLVSDENATPQHSFYTITLFIVVISLFMSIKYLFYKFVGWLFDIQTKISIWMRTYMIVFEMVGIIAFIPTLILVYSLNLQSLVFSFLVIIFIVSRIILFYRASVFFFQTKVNILYLITYLCSVEIIPYIFLFYFLKYLYKIDLTSLLWL